MSVTEEIKERLDIVEIISGSVQLRKSGRAYVGFCPFHANTRTPAFTVYPDTQSYHCFGCKASGDIFTFVMQQQGLEFRAALEMLAARAGVTLEARTPEEEQQDRRRTRLLEINSAAAKYFNYVLLSLPKGEPGRQYLAERGINQETIEAFQLGYSIDDWSKLLSYLTDKKGYEPEEIEAAGLAIRRNDGGYYDRFRGRLMFPIRNHKGETIAFGGRALGDAQPKYLNSPQTEIFDKSAVLYGLDLARDAIRQSDSIVIVEGYIDVLTGHQYGFRNLVAPLGTALTSQHVQAIKKLTRNIYLALDADAAGRRATLRGLATISEEIEAPTTPVPTAQGYIRWERELNGTVKVIAIPTGYDPDELIKSDPKLWKHLVSEAKPVMDFYIVALTEDLDLQSAKGKAEAVARLTPLLAQLTNPIEQAHYIQQLGELIEVDEQTIRSAIFRETQGQQRPRNENRDRNYEQQRRNLRNGRQYAEAYQNSQPAPSAPAPETLRPSPFVFTREDMLLVLLMRYPSGIPAVEAILSANLEQFPTIQQLLPTDPATLFQRSENRLIWHAWRSQAAPSADLNAWMEDLPNELKEHARQLFEFKLPANQAYRYKLDIEQCAHFLRTEQARALTVSLGKHIASLPEDDPERTSCMEQLLAVHTYLNTLKTPSRSANYNDLRNILNE